MTRRLPAESFTALERQEMAGRLFDLLGRQTQAYLAGDSTSVSAGTAQELLYSILYTLRLALAETGRSERDLLTADLGGLLRQGQQILQKKIPEAEELWKQVCLGAPRIRSAACAETLRSIGGFFRRYDPWYFAHSVPCGIDYPLCIPVPEEPGGVVYIERWLRALQTENWLLSRFPRQTAAGLLSEAAGDYAESPLNLCEPLLLNAVGLALLGRPVRALHLNRDCCREIAQRFRNGTDLPSQVARAAARAAEELCAPAEKAEYLQAVAEGMLPRFRTALESGSLRGLFLP